MRIAILYTPAAPDAPQEDLDGLVQLEAVGTALKATGHEIVDVPFGLNLELVRKRLLQIRPDIVFNLVESVAGHDRLLHLAPSLLESMSLPFTGASLMAMLQTTNKLEAKRIMHRAGLPTPPWIEPYGLGLVPPARGHRIIVKSAWDHGSAGLSDDAIQVLEDCEQTIVHLKNLSARPGASWFAEEYIEGREFNISVLADHSEPRVLPPAEMVFEGYEPSKPRVVGYRAKWDTSSFEYSHTIRTFELGGADQPLLRQLKSLTGDCWRLFGLRGFARVDFRVDQAGQPWILEVNANPCLSPDAGFAAALQQANIAYEQAMTAILSDL